MALVGQAFGHVGAPVPCLTPAEWERLPETAASHRVLPLAYRALKACSEAAPSDVMAHMKTGAERSWMRSATLAQELGRISEVLTDSGIPMAALKGPALAAQAYGSGVARSMHDLDVLIRPADFPRALTILEANGFVWEDPVRHLPPAAQEFYRRQATHLDFRHVRLGYLLEVHVRVLLVPSLLPISVEELIGEAETVIVEGRPVPTLSPWHHFLLVAAHGAKHGWWRLHWLADFAACCHHSPEWFLPPVNAQACWEAVDALGLGRVLQAALRLSSLCFGMPAPVAPHRAGPEAAVRAIVSHGLRSLARGRPPETSWETADWFLQLLRLRSEPIYYRQVFAAYSQVTQEDLQRFPLPAGLMRLYPPLRPWLWLIRKISPGLPPR